ncbi:MAG TPA: hypothetical protein VKT77_17285 [Chthonomonadaceae bacterium]|nr:hypothetical protein [Chthonomonadaceae bacterium]
MTVYLDLPDELAVRLMSKPETERNSLAVAALQEKLDSAARDTGRRQPEDSAAQSEDFGTFIAGIAARVAAGDGVERICRAEMYAERGP